MPVSKPRVTADQGLYTLAHLMEIEVMRKLQAEPDLKISSLVVRRLPLGVCIQGNLESSHTPAEVKRLLLEIEGIEDVINHLVPCCSIPK